VRELQNFIERAVILSPVSVLRAPVSELEPFQSNQRTNVPMNGLAEIERDLRKGLPHHRDPKQDRPLDRGKSVLP
jgi:hypothetical protein